MVPAANGRLPAGSEAEAPPSPDLIAAGWWAAEQRRATADVTLAAPDASAPLRTGSEPVGPGVTAGPSVEAQPPSGAAPAWQRRRRWLSVTRLWALVKMASLVYTTWWALGYLHAKLGTSVCAYGGICLFAGVGARWRKRFFGPGQLIEPEMYEDIGQWLYRIGTVLVLVGGTLVVARAAVH